ncbi:hypothetical protein CGLO_13753 [Colletotrichum gloeosporioides Cg-14]|uniref:Uncharacterized protein n=1 Tax=Colletotrichum gloeosporioides (strain Cg-14) TaxID=1237896 RepID=T0K313_COLGC|nr:hypothetical protein CGLO_13753 [Colletotrichum gloeosporioides Cg-14]
MPSLFEGLPLRK